MISGAVQFNASPSGVQMMLQPLSYESLSPSMHPRKNGSGAKPTKEKAAKSYLPAVVEPPCDSPLLPFHLPVRPLSRK